jgi:type II secretory pathway pseudopilin PulG
MKSRSKTKQSGVSLTGLIFVLAIVGLIAVVGMKVLPAITEYIGVKKAVAAAKSAGSTPAEVRTSFDKNAEIGYITSISGKDLEVTQVNGITEVSFAYEKKIPLVGPASIVFDFEGSTAPATLAKKKPVP